MARRLATRRGLVAVLWQQWVRCQEGFRQSWRQEEGCRFCLSQAGHPPHLVFLSQRQGPEVRLQSEQVSQEAPQPVPRRGEERQQEQSGREQQS